MPAADAERRLAAIVAIETADFARLFKADEAGALAVQKEHREACFPIGSRRGARLVRAASAGLILEIPVVNEAIDFAIEIQALMVERNIGVPIDRQQYCRIGIDHGEVIVDGAEVGGNGVNVAVRLRALAEPGGICISEAVRSQVSDREGFEIEPMGDVAAENVAQPVQVYRIRTDGEESNRHAGNPARPFRPIVAAAILLVILLVGAASAWFL